ncbi:MAG: dihydropteroate synthase, partial [Planctomycetota bacterium]
MNKHTDILNWPRGTLDFSGGAIVMGILNVTPDSFSDGGHYLDVKKAVAHGVEMAQQGAAIIDVGPESTRPGSAAVSVGDQIKRAVPVIQALLRQVNIPISIDTRIPEVAEAAVEAGASIINDITAFEEDAMTDLAVRSQTPIILMHMQGTPQFMQVDPQYEDVVTEVMEFLVERAKTAEAAGIAPERIFLDPGIGFGKTTEHNLQLLKGLEVICDQGYRVLIGASRKRFI